tara:strand:- start:22315 stop:23046 length:732 start_codon:yes stop_codon:yes gene_type:complete
MKNTILISGATSELAMNTIKKLNKSSTTFVLIYRDKNKLKELIGNLKNFYSYKADFADENFQNTFEKFLRKNKLLITSCIYFNGIHSFQPIKTISNSNLNDSFNVNVFNFIKLVQSVTKLEFSKNLTSIIAISSVASKKISKGISVYAASKASLNNFIKSFALELAPKKIRINSIILGHINAGMGASTSKYLNSEQLDHLKKQHPLGFGNKDDLYHALSFLIDDKKSRWITGTDFVLDGGYSV